MTAIIVSNYSKTLTDDQVAPAVAAIAKQVARDVGAHWWGIAPVVVFGGTHGHPAPHYPVGIYDNSDQAGALGYHEVDENGVPNGRIFYEDDVAYGASWTVTLSHEVIELAADRFADQGIQIGKRTWVAQELCDAVEADKLGYEIDGVLVSNFVTPAWFGDVVGDRFDFGDVLTQPLELAPGGYIGVWTQRSGWTQATAQTTDGTMSRAMRTHRLAARRHAPRGDGDLTARTPISYT